ncbi:hypothetical protein ACQKGO_19265 [Corallococcus interemptor]|uniref:hypothetical protein n=1 Tax=Corallococcus interemptor TaxID=2316720 RepID=UPI003D0701D6
MKNRYRIEVLVIFMLAACAPGAAVVSSAKESPQAASQEPSPEVATDAGWPAWTVTSDIPPWPCDVEKRFWKRRSKEIHVSAGDCTISVEPPNQLGVCPVEWRETQEYPGDVSHVVAAFGPNGDLVKCGRRWHCGCDEAPPE